MDELVRWLGEQLDADERIARAALDLAKPGSRARTKWNTLPQGPRATELGICPEAMLHVAVHGPVTVLSDIDAKRQIVDQFTQAYTYYDQNRRVPAGEMTGLTFALKAIALPYADRPGYREDWRP